MAFVPLNISNDLGNVGKSWELVSNALQNAGNSVTEVQNQRAQARQAAIVNAQNAQDLAFKQSKEAREAQSQAQQAFEAHFNQVHAGLLSGEISPEDARAMLGPYADPGSMRFAPGQAPAAAAPEPQGPPSAQTPPPPISGPQLGGPSLDDNPAQRRPMALAQQTEYAPAAPQAAAPAAAPPANPLVAGMQKQQAIQRQAANQLLRFSRNGQQFTLDPEADRQRMKGVRERERSEKMAEIDAAIAASPDDKELQQAGRAWQAVISAGGDLTGKDMLGNVGSLESKAATAEAAAGRLATTEAGKGTRLHDTLDVRKSEGAANRANSRGNAIIGAQGRVAASGGDVKVSGDINRGITTWGRMDQLQAAGTARHKLAAVESALGPGSTPLEHHQALMELDALARAGVASGSSMNYLMAGFGGLTDKLPQLIEKAKTGDISEEQLRQVHEAAARLRKVNDDRAEDLRRGAKSYFGPGSGYDTHPDIAQTRVAGIFAGAGLEPPQLYPSSAQAPPANPLVAGMQKQQAAQKRAAANLTKGSQRTVVRTGTLSGKRVTVYSDGTTEVSP